MGGREGGEREDKEVGLGKNEVIFFFQAEDGIRDFCLSRGLGDVYKRQVLVVPPFLSFTL
ncbi:hypothetical protein CDFC105_93910 [Clostridioides difficile]|nr:hypothetical protein CDFC105_93910 [Clostridioides difficile]